MIQLLTSLLYNTMALKQQADPQNLICLDPEEEENSFTCRETISDISIGPSSKEDSRPRHCNCRCQCGLQNELQDPVERKRQKRKEYKMRQKARLREMKQKALVMLRQIIRDIYALRVTFSGGKRALEECLRIEDNREKLYEFINEIIREEVDLIRKQLARCLLLYPQQQEEPAQAEIIHCIFDLIERIRTASPEIEKMIDLFVSCHFDSQRVELPLQRNLDRMTLKFLLRNDLQQSDVFAQICTLICQEEDTYKRECQLFHFMMNIANQGDKNCSADDNYSDSGYESQDWDEESTGDSQRQNVEGSGGKMRRRRERRRKFKEQFDDNFESILRRTEQLSIKEQQRMSCNVSEEWILIMQERQKQFTKTKQQ